MAEQKKNGKLIIGKTQFGYDAENAYTFNNDSEDNKFKLQYGTEKKEVMKVDGENSSVIFDSVLYANTPTDTEETGALTTVKYVQTAIQDFAKDQDNNDVYQAFKDFVEDYNLQIDEIPTTINGR